MGNIGRRITALAASVAAISAGLLALPSTANAAIVGSCGSGYSKIDSYKVTRSYADPYVGGYIDLYYSPYTRKNCAITRPISSWSGTAGHIWVCIEASDDSEPRDCDGLDKNYHYYAGPVYVLAPGTCIDVRGGLNRKYGDNKPYVGGAQSVHCG